MNPDIINTTENRQLLYKYLKQYAIETKNLSEIKSEEFSSNLLKKHKDNLFNPGGLAHWMGKNSLEYFCLMYLQDTFVPKENNDARELASFHHELWDELEDMFILDEFDKLVLCIPRSHAKSTVVTYALTIWLHCYNLSFYSIIQGKTEADAQKFLYDVRNTFENNEYLKFTFGDLIDTKRFTINKNELHLTNNTKIEAISSTSSMRGRKHLSKRPSFICLDDIQGLDDVLTDDAKAKKLEVLNKDVMYAGDTPVYRKGEKIKAGTKYIVIGTILAEDCLVSTLLKDKTYRHILKRGITIDNFDVDDYFNSNPHWSKFKQIYFDNKNQYAEIDAKSYYVEHEAKMTFPRLWEDKYTCVEMALKYYSDPQAFKTEIMNDASKVGQKCFFTIKTESAKEIENHDFDRTMICVDCAVETGTRNDYSAVVVGSRGLTGHRYIRKGMIYKKEFDDSVNTVFELLHDYLDITHVTIEKNTFQGRFAAALQKLVNEDNVLKHRNLTIVEERQLGNKENRIRSIAGKINNGYIIFNKDDEEFYNQILNYQGSNVGNDDAPDVVEMLDSKIDEIQTVQYIKFLPRELLF